MWKNILLVPASLIVTLVVAESISRIWWQPPYPYPIEANVLRLDSRGVWILDPGYKGTMDNNVDFRGRTLTVTPNGTRAVPCAESATTESIDRRRIYILGDSQTFGFGLSDEETWPNRLQCMLRDTFGGEYVVHNLGVYSVNIDQYYRRLSRMLIQTIRPGDLVVVAVSWNDLYSGIGPWFSERSLKQLANEDINHPPVQGEDVQRPQLSESSAVARHRTWRYEVFQKTGIFIPVFDSFRGFVRSLAHTSVVLRFAVERLRHVYFRLRPGDSFQAQVDESRYDLNFKVLAAMNEMISGVQGNMLVYLLSNRQFFDDTHYAAYSDGGRNFPQQDYMSFIALPRCRLNNLECVSSFDVLKTEIRDAYTFAYDGHYNASGAERIATYLLGYLTDECMSNGRKCIE